MVVIFLASTGVAALSDVRVKFSAPRWFKMAGLAGDPPPRPVSADTIDVGTMPLGDTASVLPARLVASTTNYHCLMY